MNHELSCRVVAYGAWGEGFENWDELVNLLKGEAVVDESTVIKKGPKPEIIPANERRRSPLPVRLAVETSWQASQMANMDPKELTCVFVSGFGDTQLTDYMCKVLATDTKELSPTKFHNSVHNAAAGYWTISTGCEKAANSVAGFQHSVPLALLEAMIQCEQEQVPILLTFFDAPVSAVLSDIMGPGSAFSFSMIIVPSDQTANGAELKATIVEESCSWPELANLQSVLKTTYNNNPSARILSLLELLLGLDKDKKQMPMGQQGSLCFSVNQEN